MDDTYFFAYLYCVTRHQMLFTSPSSGQDKPMSTEPQQFASFMGFTRRKGYTSPKSMVYFDPKVASSSPSPPIVRNQTITQLVNSPPMEEQKILWGAPTWYLFHTLAEKVYEHKFNEIRVSLLHILYTISINLPCPTCAEHAKQYLGGINFNAIQNKEQLKQMLFQFHNAVNKRKQFSQFEGSDLDEKYSKAITINVIQNFMRHYEKNSKSVRLIADDLHRQRIVSLLKTWFNTHIPYFSS